MNRDLGGKSFRRRKTKVAKKENKYKGYDITTQANLTEEDEV